MNKITILLLLCLSSMAIAQNRSQGDTYTYKKGDPNGTGKWYMGREIAYVMGYEGMDWLDRPEREKEENTSKLLKNMNIQLSNTVADIGAGSGYHVFKIAPAAKNGFVYAVDIQDEMLAVMDYRIDTSKIDNVGVIKGSEKSVNLAANSVDKVLMVDVYHEFSYPKEMIASIKKALRAQGKVYLIEYRAEDARVPIKEVHKMSEKQAVKEFKAEGFKLEKNISNLPWQHCMVFVKA
ncbi:MAG: SAM-dependent methyltransferase [Nonlabens sp.]|jgi:SAM-dependent methyltransferase